MPITVKGIRVDYVNVKRSEESGRLEIENAAYSLISSTDHVLAKQPIGSYGGMALKPSPETIKKLEAFMAGYKADIQAACGLELDQ
jgi:hypothetical protein